MEITVNGEKQELDGKITVGQLLEKLGIDPEAVIIERNLDILSLDDHGKTVLTEGDSIEIIRMVDGG
ncbi:MAG: sulfur carrier protein ThiS [bacterium]|nr:sulfur carrier protein ThiS [bacterium]MDT8366765.1 sulfur carrier protein ThiS [bacterium]